MARMMVQKMNWIIIQNRDYLSRVNNNEVERDCLEEFVTHGWTDFGHDSDESCKEDNDGGDLSNLIFQWTLVHSLSSRRRR